MKDREEREQQVKDREEREQAGEGPEDSGTFCGPEPEGPAITSG